MVNSPLWGRIKDSSPVAVKQPQRAVSLRAKHGNPGISISVRLCRTTFFIDLDAHTRFARSA